MYNNIGKKIQTLAKVLGWLLLIAGAVTCIVFLAKNAGLNDSYYHVEKLKKVNTTYAMISLVSGFVGYISTWILYGFGQMVEDTRAMREKMYAPVVEKKPLEGGWTCSCGRVNASYVSSCTCGKSKHEQ